MAKNSPTHYRLTVSRVIEKNGVRYRPDAAYKVKASVYDGLKAEHESAIASAVPITES